MIHQLNMRELIASGMKEKNSPIVKFEHCSDPVRKIVFTGLEHKKSISTIW